MGNKSSESEPRPKNRKIREYYEKLGGTPEFLDKVLTPENMKLLREQLFFPESKIVPMGKFSSR